MKPFYILVSEIRGLEAASHRFVDKYGMSMPNLSSHAVERIIGTFVDYFITIDNIPNYGHRVVAISELSFNHAKDRVEVKDIVKFGYEKGFIWKKESFLPRSDWQLTMVLLHWNPLKSRQSTYSSY